MWLSPSSQCGETENDCFVFFPFIKTLSNVILAKFKQLHRFSLCIAPSLSTSRFPGLSTVGVRVSRGLSGLRRAEGQVLGDRVTWLNRVEFAFRAPPVPTLKPFAVGSVHTQTESLEATAPTTHPVNSGSEYEE